MAKSIGSLFASIGLDSSEFQRGIRNVESQVKGLGDRLATVGSFVGIGIGITTLAGTLQASVNAAMEAERTMAALQATLESTGKSAVLSSEGIAQMSKRLADQSTFFDMDIIKMESLLLTFDNMSSDVIPRASQAVLDLSVKLGKDLQAAALLVGKAMANPTKGITAMMKAGVTFTQEQQKMVKVFMATNDIAKAQDLILTALEKHFGGSAQADLNTYAGQIKQAKNELLDFGIKLGDSLIIIADWVLKLGKLLFYLTQIITETNEIDTDKLDKPVKAWKNLNNKPVFTGMGRNGTVGIGEPLIIPVKLKPEPRDPMAAADEWAIENLKEREKELAEQEKKEASAKLEATRRQKAADDMAWKTAEDQIKDMIKKQKEFDAGRIVLTFDTKTLKQAQDDLNSAWDNELPALEKIQKDEHQRLKDLAKNTKIMSDEIGFMLQNWKDNITEAFTQAFSRIKGAWNNLLKQIAQDILKFELNKILWNGQGGSGGLLGGLFQSIGISMSKAPTIPAIPSYSTGKLSAPGQYGMPSGIVINQNLSFGEGVNGAARQAVLSMLPIIKAESIAAVSDAQKRGRI